MEQRQPAETTMALAGAALPRGRLVFERLTDPPPEGYGEGLGSNYQRQGLKLSKHFR